MPELITFISMPLMPNISPMLFWWNTKYWCWLLRWWHYDYLRWWHYAEADDEHYSASRGWWAARCGISTYAFDDTNFDKDLWLPRFSDFGQLFPFDVNICLMMLISNIDKDWCRLLMPSLIWCASFIFFSSRDWCEGLFLDDGGPWW